MEKNTKLDSSAQGAEIPNITPELVRQYLNRDLSVAISCLQAIQSDPDLLDNLSAFMAGRWQNEQNKKAHQSQKVDMLDHGAYPGPK